MKNISQTRKDKIQQERKVVKRSRRLHRKMMMKVRKARQVEKRLTAKRNAAIIEEDKALTAEKENTND